MFDVLEVFDVFDVLDVFDVFEVFDVLDVLLVAILYSSFGPIRTLVSTVHRSSWKSIPFLCESMGSAGAKASSPAICPFANALMVTHESLPDIARN